MDEVWGYETEADPHTIEVHIGRLRERFKDNPDFEIVQNNGEVAGQTVFHFHMHLIPRYKNDKSGFGWKPGKLTDEDRDEILEKLKEK